MESSTFLSPHDEQHITSDRSDAETTQLMETLEREMVTYDLEEGVATSGDKMLSAAANAIYSFILPVVCIFGILGIILTLIVLTRKTMCTSTNCYLIALSVADLIFLVQLGSMLVINYSLVPEDSRFHNAVIIYGEYAKIITNIALIASVWMTVSDVPLNCSQLLDIHIIVPSNKLNHCVISLQ